MPKRVTEYRQTLLKSLVDPEEAAYYLEAALADSKEMFLVALRDVAESRQMSKIAKDAGVAREALYRMLSDSGNPTFTTLSSILGVLGLRLTIAPKDTVENAPPLSDVPTPGLGFFASTQRSMQTTAAQGDDAFPGIRSKSQVNPQIATEQLRCVPFSQRKPPGSETTLAMSAEFNDVPKGQTDAREHKYG